MALTTLTPAGLLSAIAVDYLADSRLREAPLLSLLASNAIMQPQNEIQWGFKATYATTGGRAVTAAVADDTVATVVPANLSIPAYYVKHQFTVNRPDLVEAMTTGKITAVRNPVRTAISDALISFTQTLENALFNGDGATLDNTNYGIGGLSSILAQTGSYAGISRSSYPRVKALTSSAGTSSGGVVTAGQITAKTLTQSLISRRSAGASSMRGDGRNLIALTTPIIDDLALKNIYPPNKTEFADWNAPAKEILPFVTHLINGIPVVSDVNCPQGTLYWINLSKMALYGFDDSPAHINDPKTSYFPLIVDSDGNSPEETSLMIRLSDVSSPHPDLWSFEMSARVQLAAFDPIDSVTAITDIADPTS